MMRKQTAAVLLASALLLSAMTGCGKPKVEDSTADAVSSAEQMQETTSGASQTPADAGESASGEDGEISGAEKSGSDSASESSKAQSSSAASDSAAAQQTAPPGGEDDQEGGYSAGNSTPEDAKSQNAGDTANVRLHVTVETVEISAEELAAQDYTVPLLITLDQNPGISYSEWGLKLDDRCTYETSTKGMDFSTVAYINEEKHFLWTAWASGSQLADYDGTLLQLNVTVPHDAASGTTYKIEYADMSLADAPHIWADSKTDWVALGEVGWTDGGVVIK